MVGFGGKKTNPVAGKIPNGKFQLGTIVETKFKTTHF
jgi:hypothetical protein